MQVNTCFLTVSRIKIGLFIVLFFWISQKNWVRKENFSMSYLNGSHVWVNLIKYYLNTRFFAWKIKNFMKVTKYSAICSFMYFYFTFDSHKKLLVYLLTNILFLQSNTIFNIIWDSVRTDVLLKYNKTVQNCQPWELV